MNYDDIKGPLKRGLSCSICARPATDAHHVNQKGIGGRGDKAIGDPDDATPLCRDCHEAYHAGNMKIRRGSDGHICFKPNAAYAKRLSRRGLRCKEGNEYVARYEGVALSDLGDEHMDATPLDPAVGDLLHTLEREYAEVALADYTVFRCRSERLARARDLIGDESRFRAWRLALTDSEGHPIPVTDAQASRMLTVADHLPDDVARSMPATRQYLLARALRDKVAPLETLLPAAESLTARAFEEEYLGREEYTPPQGCCPDCGSVRPLADFKEVQRD